MEQNDYYMREKGHAPSKSKCNSNLVDDGVNCVDNTTCIRVACDDPKGCIKCLDSKKIPFEERLTCGKDEEKINNMCYKKCTTGYIGDDTKCYKGVDPLLIKKLTETDNEDKEIEDKSKDSFNLFNYILDFFSWLNKKIKNLYGSLGKYRFLIVILLICLIIYYYFFMSQNKINYKPLESCNSRLNNNIMKHLLSDTHSDEKIQFIILK